MRGDIEDQHFRYAGAPAWHGLGTKVPDSSTVEAAMQGTVIGSEILRVPLAMPGPDGCDLQAVTLPSGADMVAIVRSGDWRTLAVRTDGFQVAQPMDAARLLDAVGGEVGARFSVIGSIKAGCVFWAQAEIDSFDVTGNGDLVRTYLTFTDGYDGKHTASFGLTTVRAVCENTITHAIEQGRGSVAWHAIRHRGDVTNKLAAAAAAVDAALKGKAGLRDFARKLARTPFDTTAMDSLAKQILGAADSAEAELPAQTRAKVETLIHLFADGTGNHGRTAWDALNAVSEWSTWAQPVRGRERFEIALLGDPVVQQAEQLLRVYVQAA